MYNLSIIEQSYLPCVDQRLRVELLPYSFNLITAAIESNNRAHFAIEVAYCVASVQGPENLVLRYILCLHYPVQRFIVKWRAAKRIGRL